MADGQLLSLGPQNIHCIGRKAVFDENLIGEPLLMKPGRVDGFLNVKREIDDADKDVGYGGDDGGPPGEPRTRKSLPSLSTMVGVIAESGRLPGPMRWPGPG